VSKVTNMIEMFEEAENFNRDFAPNKNPDPKPDPKPKKKKRSFFGYFWWNVWVSRW